MFVTMTSSLRQSSNRLIVKSNQNECIIQLTMEKSMKALYYTHEVINIASAGEKEVHFLIISHSHNEDSILSESKIFQLSLFDLNTRGTMLGTENDTWHPKRCFPSTNVTFDEPCQNNHVSFDQCYQGLPREYPAGVQASSSLLRWSSTVPCDHLYLECLLFKIFPKSIERNVIKERGGRMKKLEFY